MKVDPLTPEETEALDPGIRRLVTLLRAHGFETTDSGDGVTKPRAAFTYSPLDGIALLSVTGISDKDLA